MKRGPGKGGRDPKYADKAVTGHKSLFEAASMLIQKERPRWSVLENLMHRLRDVLEILMSSIAINLLTSWILEVRVNAPTRKNPKNARRKAALNSFASKVDLQTTGRLLERRLKINGVIGSLPSEGVWFNLLHPSFIFLTINESVGFPHPLILWTNDNAAKCELIVDGA